jgi:hypothetical protein|tara:strand:- start:588 stop:827 length:240 start_codon:yes stop_codon:yes gene_type:complete
MEHKVNLGMLEQESEALYFRLKEMTEAQIPELAELLVNLALRDIMSFKEAEAELALEDYILATQLAVAFLEIASGRQRH